MTRAAKTNRATKRKKTEQTGRDRETEERHCPPSTCKLVRESSTGSISAGSASMRSNSAFTTNCGAHSRTMA